MGGESGVIAQGRTNSQLMLDETVCTLGAPSVWIESHVRSSRSWRVSNQCDQCMLGVLTVMMTPPWTFWIVSDGHTAYAQDLHLLR
jgi:hypothetical protein